MLDIKNKMDGIKQHIIHFYRKDLWSQRGRMGGGVIDWEFGVSGWKLLHIEWINNKVLLYGSGKYIQYPMINCNGKENEKEYIYVYN